jgi:hypothetical protein
MLLGGMKPRFDTSHFGQPEETSFKDKLDALHDWPCLFVFKFIMRPAHIFDFQKLFPDEQWKARNSSAGNYVCITMEKTVAGSDEVLAIYARAGHIPGVLML